MSSRRTIPAFCLFLAVCASGHSQTRPDLRYRPSVVIQISVTDLTRAIEFYERTLDMKIGERREDLGFAHVETNVPGLEIGLSAGGTLSGTGAAVLNLGVADVAEARRLLESRGVVFAKPTQVIPGKVALAEFMDPDRNRLRLAGPPPLR